MFPVFPFDGSRIGRKIKFWGKNREKQDRVGSQFIKFYCRLCKREMQPSVNVLGSYSWGEHDGKGAANEPSTERTAGWVSGGEGSHGTLSGSCGASLWPTRSSG